MIEPKNDKITIRRQCELLGLARSSAYYKSCRDTSADGRLMKVLDEQYTRTPFYGVRRMTEHLCYNGYGVGERRVRRLLRAMGLMAIYPKKRTTIPDNGHRKYPYLLKGIEITRPNHVWCTDITYIRMKKGFAYLTVILDWVSRYVVAWELSVTLEAGFCVDALERALLSGKPEIFNSDQGSQFTSETFTGILLDAGVAISMDGRGRVYDNIFVERFWRTVKYEEVYLKSYESVSEARESLGRYFEFYNCVRPHQSLGYRTPRDVYAGADGSRKTFGASVATRFGLRPPLVATGLTSESQIHLKMEKTLS